MIMFSFVSKPVLKISFNTISTASHTAQLVIMEIKQQVSVYCQVDARTIFMQKTVQDCVLASVTVHLPIPTTKFVSTFVLTVTLLILQLVCAQQIVQTMPRSPLRKILITKHAFQTVLKVFSSIL